MEQSANVPSNFKAFALRCCRALVTPSAYWYTRGASGLVGGARDACCSVENCTVSNLFHEFRGTILLCERFNFKMKVIVIYCLNEVKLEEEEEEKTKQNKKKKKKKKTTKKNKNKTNKTTL